MEAAQADIILFGHTINIGSVGKPKDGDPRAFYAMMEMNTSLSLHDAASVSVRFVRVEYDVEKAAKAVEQSELPNAYANALRHAQ